MSQQPRSFVVKFRLKKGNDGYQTAVVQASSGMVARKIFEQSNPGCVVSQVNEVKR